MCTLLSVVLLDGEKQIYNQSSRSASTSAVGFPTYSNVGIQDTRGASSPWDGLKYEFGSFVLHPVAQHGPMGQH